MVTIKHTGGIIAEKDKNKVPKVNFGRHSNGSEWTYFETQEEKDKFYTENFPKPIETVKEINPLIEAVKEMTPEEKAKLLK